DALVYHFRRGNNPFAVGAERGPVDIGQVPLERSNRLAGARVPEMGGLVRRGGMAAPAVVPGEQAPAVRTEDPGANDRSVPWTNGQELLVARGIPDGGVPGVARGTTPPAVGTPRAGKQLVPLALQDDQLLPGPGIPDAGGVV